MRRVFLTVTLSIAAAVAYAADEWVDVATISGTTAGYLCDVTDDGKDVSCKDPNPTIDGSGNFEASGYVSGTVIYGDGSGLRNVPASAVTGMSADRIISGTTSVVASEDTSITFTTANTQRMVIDENGNVGIGESNPNTVFHVRGAGGSTTPLVTLESDEGSYAFMEFRGDGTGTEYFIGRIDNGDADQLTIGRTNVSHDLILTNTGYIGIGTRSPSDTFHVEGSIRMADDGEDCDTNRTGAIKYTSGDFYVCRNGSGWESFASIANGAAPDWYGLTNIPAGVVAISDTALATAELTQLQNIDATTVSTAQWGYLGALNQGLTTTSDVAFNTVAADLTGNVEAAVVTATTTVNAAQLCDETGANCQDLSAGITASGADWYDLTSIPAGVVAISDTALATAELTQLQNIDATTVSTAQWGYLGALDQGLTSTSDVAFNTVAADVTGDLTGNVEAAVVTATTTVNAAQLCDETGANCQDLSAGITASGADWYDLTSIPAGVVAISDTALATAELTQLQNIDATTVSTAQWGYLGALDQGLTSTSDVAFNTVAADLTGNVEAAVVTATTTVNAAQLCDETGANCQDLSAGITASGADWYDLTNIPAGVVAISDTALATAELTQLQNIDATTVSTAQWGYLGALDQGLTSTSDVAFNTVAADVTGDLTGNVEAAVVTATATVNAAQLCDETGANCQDLSAGITASGADWYDLTSIPAGVVAISDTALATAELTQLQNIDATTVSTAQWGYLGALDQGLTSTSDVAFNTVAADLTGNVEAAVVTATTTVNAAQLCDETGANCQDLSAGITASGADWYDLTNIPAGVVAISDTALATAELTQLQNIDATTVSTAQWGYLGALDQGLTTTSDVAFNTVAADLTGNVEAAVVTATTTVNAAQLCDETGANCQDLSAGITASAADWYDISNIPAGVVAISDTALATAELTQLQNIDATTVSTAQWAYVGGFDQGLATTSDVAFNTVAADLTGNVQAAVITATTTVNAAQLCDETGANCQDLSAGIDGNASGVAGAVQFSDGSKLTSDETNLFWDDTNNRLGVGTNGPDEALEVNGAVKISGDSTSGCSVLADTGQIRLDPSTNKLQICKPAP